MPSGSTNSRKKMKKERPEKYQQYLDSQKKRSAEYRRKMKEAMANPTEKDEERRKKHLEKQRARMQRYLERKKRQRTATQSVPVHEDTTSSNRESDQNEPVSSTSGNVDDMQHGGNITSSQRADTQQQDGETRYSGLNIPYQDREISSQGDIDSPDEGLHIFQEDMEGVQASPVPNDAEISQSIFSQGQDSLRQILDIPDYDLEMRQLRHGANGYHQNEEISQPDEGPVNHSIQLQRQSPSNIASPLMAYLNSLNNSTVIQRSDADTQNHTTGIENTPAGNIDSHVQRNYSEKGNIDIFSVLTPASSTEPSSLPLNTMTRIRMEENEPPFTRSDIWSSSRTNSVVRPTPVNGSETLEYINMDTGKQVRREPSPSQTVIITLPEPPLNLSTQRSPVPFPSNAMEPVYSASVWPSTSHQPISTTSVHRGQNVLVDTQLANELNPLRQEGGPSNEALPNILQEDMGRNITNVIPGARLTEVNASASVGINLSSQACTSNSQVAAHDRFLDSIAGPSLPPPTPYTRYKSQQITSVLAATLERAPHYNACVEHPGEKVRVRCIDCDQLLCVECLPGHRRHVLTGYRVLEKGEIMRQIDVTIDLYPFRMMMMMMIGSVFYFNTDDSITTYNMNTDKTERIDIDDGCIQGMCVSPDNTSIWYCTNQRKVYEYDVENRTHQLRFTRNSDYTLAICVTRSGHVVLGVIRRSDDSYSDSDDSDIERYEIQYYLQMYTQQDSYKEPITSVCIKRKRGLKYGVIPYYIRECPVTGDLLVIDDTEFEGNTVLLTDNKCNTKYWFRGKTVKNKHGERKRTGYDSRLRTSGAACFDKEGNILIVNGYESVIVIDHDTGMYIRTVHQEPDICRICIQDNGLLWCCVGSRPKYKLKSIKYMEKLQ